MEEELVYLEACLEFAVEVHWIESFEIIAQSHETLFDPGFFQHHVYLHLGDRSEPIICTGVHRDRGMSILIALAEGVERLFLLTKDIRWFRYSRATKRITGQEIEFKTTNGMAIHHCVSDALTNAVYECLERHYLQVLWYGRSSMKNRVVLPDYIVQATAGRRCNIALSHSPVANNLHQVVLHFSSDDPELQCRNVLSTAVHHDLCTAIEIAWRESLMCINTRPASKSSPIETPLTILDHLLFYQQEKNFSAFDFLQATSLPVMDPQPISLPHVLQWQNILGILEDQAIDIDCPQLPLRMSKLCIFRVSSPILLDIKFGEDWKGIDRDLLESLVPKYSLAFPHPLS